MRKNILEYAPIADEVLRSITGYEGIYEISNLGRLLMVNIPKLIICPSINRGYFRTSLTNNKISKLYYVHRLVAETFIPNPENKKEVNHINGIKTDNRVENLEWVTHSEQILHAYRIGLLIPKTGGEHPKSIFKQSQAEEIRNSNLELEEICNQYSLPVKTVKKIMEGNIYSSNRINSHRKIFFIGRKTKLTVEDILGIFISDLPYKDLEKKYGVSGSTVSGIKTGIIHSKITGKSYVRKNTSKISLLGP